MRLWRVFPYNPGAEPGAPGHPLFVPRLLQGAGRHDNPDLYGALYLSESPLAAIAEHIAHLRGQTLDDADLARGGLRLSTVQFELPTNARIHDLDDPTVLARLRLKPSEVATRNRATTQRWAARVYRSRPAAGGLRWWSTLAASWLHVTLFAERYPMRVMSAPQPLHLGHPEVMRAAEQLGIRA